jgi:hypothetical protein
MTPGIKSGGGAEKDKHSAENDKNSAENDEMKVPKKSAETGGNRVFRNQEKSAVSHDCEVIASDQISIYESSIHQILEYGLYPLTHYCSEMPY